MSGSVNPRIPAVATPATSNVITNGTISTTGNLGVSIYDPYADPGDWRFFGFSLGIIVVVLGTAGNGLTVWAYKNNRNLQTSFNVLIANLCCIELVFSLIIIPLQLPGYILKTNPYSDGVCAAVGYFYYASMGASLHNLVAIAINRYIGIVNTKRYQKMFTGNRLKLWIISIWILSPILYLPLPIGGAIRWSQETSMRCAVNSSGNYGIKLYNTVLTVVYQVGGLLILIVLYASIIIKVKQVQRKLKVHRKASFKRTKKASTTSDGRAEGHTPGTTSGEECGIEDYRPSSVISGGFNFRPAKDVKHTDFTSDSGHGSDREGLDHINKHLSDTHSNSRASHISPSPSPNKQERRTSLWQILFKPKTPKQMAGKEESIGNIFDYTTDEESRRDPTDTRDEMKNQPPQHEEIKIILRDMDTEKREIRRKKSLSAPTLPSLEDIIELSRKNSAAVAQNIPEKVAEANEGSSQETSPMRLSRAYTVGSKYKKHFQRGANGSVRMNGTLRGMAENSKLLSPSAITDRLCKSDKNVCSSMPTLAPQSATMEVPTSQPRFGTIARKIMKDQRSKRYKDRSQRRKQRAKAMRRRHARERQLVYSSLTICIAFAICLLPTSVLFVAQTIFKFEVAAAVWLTVSSIAWLHAVVNPFIYGYMNHLYRKEYGHIAKDLEKKLTICLK